MKSLVKSFTIATATLAGIALSSQNSFARDVAYDKGEVSVRVAPGEPTQVQFPGVIDGGFHRKVSSLSLAPKDNDLVIFANDNINESGEALIVRLKDGRSYSVRITRASPEKPRDDLVTISDARGAMISSEEEEPAYKERKFDYAPPSQVSGLMREMVLAAELGKSNIPGYRMTEAYRGESILNDGTIQATIDRIFIGPNLWGYVLDTKNLLDQTQKINAAAFRIDGTRAVSAKNWELAPMPLTVEHQIAGDHKTKVYIITKARKQ